MVLRLGRVSAAPDQFSVQDQDLAEVMVRQWVLTDPHFEPMFGSHHDRTPGRRRGRESAASPNLKDLPYDLV